MFSLLQNWKLRAHVTDLVKRFSCQLDPGLEVDIFEMWEELLPLPFGEPLCIYCPICKDKHKLVIPQTIIEVIQSVIRTVKYFDELHIKIN